MNWFRLYGEFATDPKVQMLSEADQRRLVMLFCIRCSNDDETFHDEQVAFQLRVSLEEWQRSKALFIEKGFLNSDGKLRNWDKRQYRSDSSTERVRAYRDREKQERNVSVTPPDTDTDTDTERAKSSLDTSNEVSVSTKRADAPVSEIVKIYHELLPELPKLRKLTTARRAQIAQRWREDLTDLDDWRKYFSDFVKPSDFLMGRAKPNNGHKLFRADLSWITKAENFAKIIEGKYRG